MGTCGGEVGGKVSRRIVTANTKARQDLGRLIVNLRGSDEFSFEGQIHHGHVHEDSVSNEEFHSVIKGGGILRINPLIDPSDHSGIVLYQLTQTEGVFSMPFYLKKDELRLIDDSETPYLLAPSRGISFSDHKQGKQWITQTRFYSAAVPYRN